MDAERRTSGIFLLDEQIRLRTLQTLMRQSDTDAARIFATCALTLTVDDVIASDLLSSAYTLVDIVLGCPADYAEMLRDPGHPVTVAIRGALAGSLPPHTLPQRFATVTIAAATPSRGETAEASTISPPGAATNQGRPIAESPVFVWEHLHFRSKTEIRIAQALDRAGALYFPNCRARLGLPDARRTLEPDFLVCHHGSWGVLEVDGEPFHLDGEKDGERDMTLRAAGVAVIARYSATECYERPDEVVSAFLRRIVADSSRRT